MTRIDTHHHVYPPAMTDSLIAHGFSGQSVPEWTLELDQAINAKIDVTTAILSVTAPGPTVETNSTTAAALARSCNEYNAKLRDDNPAAYGFFLSVPSLYDTDLALEEIRYGFDTLNADGIVLMSSYGTDGTGYLGNAAFKPIWEELNNRNATVFVHPTNSIDNKTSMFPGLVPPMFDWPHETGRTAMSLILNGNLQNYKNVKIILSHAGGDLPYLIYRPAVLLATTPNSTFTVDGIIDLAREAFWFDVAISSNPYTLDALFAFAKPGHVLFGSDFPNAGEQAILDFNETLNDYKSQLTQEQWNSLEYEAAQELFPRFK